jgi:hypothetical protein
MRTYRIVLTSSKRMVTKYVEIEGEMTLALVKEFTEKIREEEKLGSLKMNPTWIEVNKDTHRAIKRPAPKAPTTKKAPL